MFKTDGFKEMFSTFKRSYNIIKNMEISVETPVDEKTLDNSYEKELFAAFKSVTTKTYDSFEENLDALFGA